MKDYFSINDNVLVVIEHKDEKELKEIGKKENQFIYLPGFALIKYRNNRLEYFFLKEHEINQLIKRTYNLLLD